MPPDRALTRTPLFVDRESERAQLRALLERPGPNLALVTGRRRVGKTYLLTNTWSEAQVLASAGHMWARKALRPEAPLLYVTGGKFSPDFTARAEQDGHPVITLTLDDLYHGLTPAVRPSSAVG